MKRALLAVLAAAGLTGCVYDDYGTGVSLGYGSSYGGYGYGDYGYGGYGGYGYGGYDRYRDRDCIRYDRYGRAYYSCNQGGYYGSNGYYYTPRATVYYYPGYSYRRGYYYDRYHRRYEPRELYRRHHRHHRDHDHDRDDD